MESLTSFCFSKGRKLKETEPDNTAPVETFSLPSPIPEWPKDGGFAKGKIQIGELELVKIVKFQKIWSFNPQNRKKDGVTFYKPVGVPDGFFLLGHYCHPNNKPLHGFALVARENTSIKALTQPPLQKPTDYKHIWKSNSNNDESSVYFWAPLPPEGYQAMGFLVTKGPDKPLLDEIACVRSDLTDKSEARGLILSIVSRSKDLIFQVWNTRPIDRGIKGQGIPTGTFFCSANPQSTDDFPICLKNVNFDLHAMPNLEQVHALIQHYGPMVFFHPKERYLPSSVSWFFQNGAALCTQENSIGESIAHDGSNLPVDGNNDGQYWIDIPTDKEKRKNIIFGNLDSAELYCHIKPAFGGTFTDIAMWIFCPFNGPGRLKLGLVNIPLGIVGRHIGDWEHFTLRISNFDGKLSSIYYSQHSGGIWVDVPELEFITGNKAAVYFSKHGHAGYPRAGLYLQGSQKLGIGIRNDAARSDFVLDSSMKYQIVAGNYLGDDVVEPHWLRYMRQWGPKIIYRTRLVADSIMNKLPSELRKEEGPTGPKEKNNWHGDERY